MKKILVAALLLTAPTFAMAQQKSGERRTSLTAEQRAEKHTARIDQIVSLSPEQRQKIHAENLRTAEAMQPHLDNIRAERQAMRDIGKQRNQAYTRILTPEQMERLKAAHKGQRDARKAHGNWNVPSQHGAVQTDAPNK